jgi:hypothetical protein
MLNGTWKIETPRATAPPDTSDPGYLPAEISLRLHLFGPSRRAIEEDRRRAGRRSRACSSDPRGGLPHSARSEGLRCRAAERQDRAAIAGDLRVFAMD